MFKRASLGRLGELSIIVLLTAAVLLAAVGCGEVQPQTDIPPEPQSVGPTVELFSSVFVEKPRARMIEVNGVRCIAAMGYEGNGVALSCDWSRPPIYGEVESAAQVASFSGCTTDTDCMEKFGGDGSPMPLREYLRQQRATEF